MPNLHNLLRDCYITNGRNVVEAGLVKSATLTPDTDAPGAGIPGVPTRYIAHVVLYAPGLDEAANAQLAAQVENRLLGIEVISRAEVALLPALFPIL